MPENPYAGPHPSLYVSNFTNGDDVDSDSTDLTEPAYGFHALASGTVKFDMPGGRTMTLPVTAGIYYPYAVKRLYTTGHTTIDASHIELAR